jgi:hypothetical protein
MAPWIKIEEKTSTDRYLPLGDLVDRHLNRQDPDFLAYSLGQLEVNASHNMATKRDHNSMLVIPIAAHQERPSTVVRALGQVNLQYEQYPKFFTVLSLNSPEALTENEQQNFLSVVHAVRQCQQSMDVPLSFFDAKYDSGTTIGKIKKDNHDAAINFLRNMYGAEALPDPFGIFRQDVDVVRLSPGNMRCMGAAFDAGKVIVQGTIRHARSRGRYKEFPDSTAVFKRMDVLLWLNDLGNYMGEPGFSEVNNLVSLREYLWCGGVDPKDKKAEIINSIVRTRNIMSSIGLKLEEFFKYSRHDFVVVSPRRAYQRMQEGVPPHLMWNLREKPFKATEDYRLVGPNNLVDLTRRQYRKLGSFLIPPYEVDEDGRDIGHLAQIYDRYLGEEKDQQLATKKYLRSLAIVGAILNLADKAIK